MNCRVALLPDHTPEWMLRAATAAGAELVDVADADTLVWGGVDAARALAAVIDEHGDHLEWVQLPWAGVEPYLDLLDTDRTWTCAKGAYADDVAEMALALALAGMRGIGTYSRSRTWREHGELGRNLAGSDVCIVGGGGISEHLVELLAPFSCRVTVVRRRPSAMAGVDCVVGNDELDPALAQADLVVLALALAPGTTGMIDARRLASMREGCWIVNVARGAHIVTDDLVEALRSGSIGGAALDVTDPEPLPPGHPLWSLDNCIITPHVANTSSMLRPRLEHRISENVRRRVAGEPLLGVIDVDAGY